MILYQIVRKNKNLSCKMAKISQLDSIGDMRYALQIISC